MYDLDGNNLLTRDALTRFITVIYGADKLYEDETQAMLDDLVQGYEGDIGDESDDEYFGDAITFKQFRRAAMQARIPLLLDWLFREIAPKLNISPPKQLVQLQQKYDPLLVHKELAQCMHFDLKEVEMMRKHFDNFATQSESGLIDKEGFKALLFTCSGLPAPPPRSSATASESRAAAPRPSAFGRSFTWSRSPAAAGCRRRPNSALNRSTRTTTTV